MSIFLKKEELKDTYFEAETHSEEWFKPFLEYERLAGNKLSPTLGKDMPRVNDGSLAASLLETPMQVLPTMQPGKFKSNSGKAWVDEIINLIWKNQIVPNANTQSTFFDKEQIALYRALKYGAQPRYNFFVSTENYTGSDWSLPYVKNVKLEPGKYSLEDCDYVFLDVYYTKLQLQNILDQAKKEASIAKKEGRESDNSWDVASLTKLIGLSKTTKEYQDLNINERDRVNSSGIKTTTCFQRGVNAPFYMFSKHLEDGELLREWNNPDPRGELPITMQYCYETLESPYGIGRVELAGPTQNVLDYMTQAHILATQIGIQPPKKISGPIDTADLSSITNTPDALWVMGQAQIDIVQPTSSVYTQFPQNYGLYKSQLQTLQGRTDGSVSGESGNPTFSKTQAGVKMQEQRTHAQDNYLRNKADIASAKMAEKMMNVHLANMSGAEILEIVEEDRERLLAAGYFDENPGTEEPSLSEIAFLYEDIKGTVKFEFDPRPEADGDEKNRWLELIDIVSSNPTLIPAIQFSGYEFNIGEAFKKVISASGADGWDKVLVKMEDQQQIDPMTGQPVGQAIDPATGQPMGPTGPMAQEGMHQMPDGSMMPDAEMVQGEMDSITNDQIANDVQQVMDQYQVEEDVAKAMIAAHAQGFSEEEILAYLQGGQGG